MKWTGYYCCALVWALVIASEAHAVPTGYHFYTEHLPPYSYMQDDRVTGINAELVSTLCQRLELSCTISILPWRRAFGQAQREQNSGVFSTTRAEDREALFKWVGPIATDHGYVFRLRDRTEINPTNLEQAKNYVLAVSRGGRLETYFQHHGFSYDTNMMGFSTRTEPIPLFLAKKIDLLAGSKRALASWMNEHNMPADTAEPLFRLNNVGEHYLALNLQFPATVATKLQSELDKMRQSGELAALIERYQG
ncbi:amino acid ABC transporter substrate-binding protein, PAAT family [Arsukibacterium tuosuense]|uniref:Amino acid ABC transporter substrate-binding protein, PAAT family n=1 Tax=Arsukibacterium tuosuense TaxID=1323745 RepID=A0A285JK59_9GAMM|nr:ABC transporter substrate-binding protein [Arsukibacterium tuosuense]SNY60453.1 amino acid ABC transporter substrate-binding protein, PAAT family [Arsukibacterium tuosuense]